MIFYQPCAQFTVMQVVLRG